MLFLCRIIGLWFDCVQFLVCVFWKSDRFKWIISIFLHLEVCFEFWVGSWFSYSFFMLSNVLASTLICDFAIPQLVWKPISAQYAIYTSGNLKLPLRMDFTVNLETSCVSVEDGCQYSKQSILMSEMCSVLKLKHPEIHFDSQMSRNLQWRLN